MPPAGATLGGLTRELARFIEMGLEHGDCYMIFEIERPEPCANRFVQVAFDGAGLHAEASAMVCLPWECDGRHDLSPSQITRLRALGWSPPAGDPDADTPNWHRSFGSMRHDLVPLVAELLTRTLVEVMEFDDTEGAELTVTIDRFAPPEECTPRWPRRRRRLFCRRW